jgi:hypothetical protein
VGRKGERGGELEQAWQTRIKKNIPQGIRCIFL